MSSKKKNSLLNRVLGKGKDADEEGGGGKGKKGKKGKLEKQPSIRESVHSERRQTMHSVTHASEAPLHYEEDEYHHGAPVTAVHEEDPYSPFDDGGSYMREPSAINVRPASHVHLGHQSMGHQSGGDYFEQPFSESPRAHPNVISLGEHAHPGHAEPEAHVAIAGVSRQPTILSPHHQSTEAPRMLKPGDQMEIDPRNPPTFVVDEGVTLEIGDEENGFVPYEQYLANLAKQPPPSTGGTYIVQGGGDVVIQDENGDVIKTIPGTGAMAGRGEPQIHHPPHLIPVLVSLSRRATKPRNLRQLTKRQGKFLTISKAPVRAFSGPLDSILEPEAASAPRSFASLFDLVEPAPQVQRHSNIINSIKEGSDATYIVDGSRPTAPARPIPSTPTRPTSTASNAAGNVEDGRKSVLSQRFSIVRARPISTAPSRPTSVALSAVGNVEDENKTPSRSSIAPARPISFIPTPPTSAALSAVVNVEEESKVTTPSRSSIAPARPMSFIPTPPTSASMSKVDNVEEEESKPSAPSRPIPSTPTRPTSLSPAALEDVVDENKPTVPTRSIPSTPTTPTIPSADSQLPSDPYPLGQTLPMATPYHEPPMASPASFEDFDEFEASEYTDSDLAFTGSMLDAAKAPTTVPSAMGISLQTRLKLAGTAFPRAAEGTSPATPIDELSDLSEIILSPVRTRSMASDASQRSALLPDDAGRQQQELPAPWAPGPDRGTRLYGFQGDYVQASERSPKREERSPKKEERSPKKEKAPSPVTPSPRQTSPRQTSPTLTHSRADSISTPTPEPEARQSSPPPPRPVRNPNRPSPASSRHNSITSDSRHNSISNDPSLPLPPPIAMVRQTHRNPIPIPTSTYAAEKSTQPRLTPSPKILAMIQKFEGTSRETEDLGNFFIGNTRSLSVGPKSRSGSVSSSKMDPGYGSSWMPYSTPPSTRPSTPNSVSEFGEQVYAGGGPSNLEIAREVRWKSDGRTSDMVNQGNWDLRPVGPPRRGSSSSTYRPSMTQAIPGLEVQPGLLRELSLKRRQRAGLGPE